MSRFANGARARALCDVCGFEYRLGELRRQVVKGVTTNVYACSNCWSPDHPQNHLGRYPVEDPQAIHDARVDTGYVVSGVMTDSSIGMGNRVIQWNWNPVGGSPYFDTVVVPNDVLVTTEAGDLTVETT